MKLIFVGDSLDHIALSLCNEFYNLLGNEFAFVATKSFNDSRSDLGYGSLNDKYSYVIKGYENKERVIDKINDANIVIYGAAPEEYVKKRMLDGKLTFRFTERLYKKPCNIKNSLYRRLHAMQHHGRYQNKNVYVLCAGAYVSYDFSRYGYYKDKCFKWCYFTKVSDKKYDELCELKNNNTCTELVWTARFVALKHPEVVVKLAEYLKKNKADFHITMLGGGELLEDTKKLAKALDVEDYISFTGPVNPGDVCKSMEKADISLFTSDRLEGWGAVVNEAMGSGCAVVASCAVGSTPFLVKDGENGLMFDIDDLDGFYAKVLTLVNDKDEQRRLGQKAYKTVQEMWTAEKAAKSFLALAESILAGKIQPANDGPCSIAPILKDGWYNKK